MNTTPDKTAYRIFYRILSVASGQHLVVVSGMPANANATGDGSEVRSESRLFPSAEVAALECRQMVESMHTRLVSAGHEVTLVSVL